LNSLRAGQVSDADLITGLRSKTLPVVKRKTTMPTSVAGTSSGTGGNQPAMPLDDNIYRGSRHRMPKPGERNAPEFDPEKPEELGRFFERIEDWFLDEEITDNLERKRKIVKYLDADSEVQWKALSTFATGTYEEFKSQVMASYPAAEEVMKGSVSALRRKIKKLGPVPADDRDELLQLVRVMTAEIMKLKKIAPPIHTNRELVDLFLERLDPDFAARVANKLAVHRLIHANLPVNQVEPRNPEDMYDIEEVMEMAKQTSLEQANPFGKFLAVSTTSAPPVIAKFEEAIAHLNDSIKVQMQHSQTVDQKLSMLQNFMQQPKQGYSDANHGCRTHGHQASGSSAMNCFYCDGAHRMGDCEEVRIHLDLGLLKKVEGRLRLADGSRLPKEPGKTTRELVEALKSRPGIVMMSKIQDKTSLYPRTKHYMQSQSNEQDEEGVMQELIHKLGTDRVRQCLQAREEYIAEAAEWEQNFD
jgi:hypothetical protein